VCKRWVYIYLALVKLGALAHRVWEGEGGGKFWQGWLAQPLLAYLIKWSLLDAPNAITLCFPRMITLSIEIQLAALAFGLSVTPIYQISTFRDQARSD
jgi:hypothetical protein